MAQSGRVAAITHSLYYQSNGNAAVASNRPRRSAFVLSSIPLDLTGESPLLKVWEEVRRLCWEVRGVRRVSTSVTAKRENKALGDDAINKLCVWGEGVTIEMGTCPY